MRLSYIKKLPIAMQLSILSSLIVLVMLIIMAANYVRAVEVVKRDNANYMKGIISQLNQSIASNSDDIKKIIETVTYNERIVQKYLSLSDPIRKFEAYIDLKAYMMDMKGMKDGILDIALVGKSGSRFNLLADMDQLAAIAPRIPGQSLYYFLGLEQIGLPYSATPVLVAGAPIYSTTDFDAGEHELGTLLLVLDNRALFGSGNPVNLPQGALIYMTDRSGRVFYTNDEKIPLGSTVAKSASDQKYMVQSESLPELGGEVVIKMPNRILLQGLNAIRREQLIMVFVALIFMLLPFQFVINNILQPLKKLMRLMSEVRLGQKDRLSKRIEVDGYAEMITMASRFNEMMSEIEDLTIRLVDSERLLYETELIKRRAELSYLQSQINPHFLYNTLESIKGLAADEGSARIFDLTKALGLFFRYSIKGPDMVTLDREWNIVKNYIYIHQIRFGERLQAEYDFSPECLTCIVPKMILQPIVENAINYGIEPLKRNGRLAIKGWTDGVQLNLTVEDDGTGIPADRLEEIKRSLKGRSPLGESESGIGLVNVHERIRIKFGDDYGVRIDSELQAGTKVLITMPMRGEA